jgi:hypothetical protein
MGTQAEFEAEQTAALAEIQRVPILKPSYFNFGMGYSHNMPCCVYTDTDNAVLDTSIGVFKPSWRAQKEGWHTVQAKTRLQRWVLKKLFGERI